MSTDTLRYRGDGVPAKGTAGETRGEKGRYLADPQLVAAVNTALIVEQPMRRLGESGGRISSRIASNTTLNCLSYLDSSLSSLSVRSFCALTAFRRLTNALMTYTLT